MLSHRQLQASSGFTEDMTTCQGLAHACITSHKCGASGFEIPWYRKSCSLIPDPDLVVARKYENYSGLECRGG